MEDLLRKLPLGLLFDFLYIIENHWVWRHDTKKEVNELLKIIIWIIKEKNKKDE